MGGMNALTTLDGVTPGTDVAVKVSISDPLVQRWQVTDDGGLLRQGKRLDQWFLSGLLAEGRVYHGDFSPAQPGEWFIRTTQLRLLVVAVDKKGTHVAQFVSGEFNRWAEERDLIEQGIPRCPRPEWSGTGESFFRMALLAWKQEQAAKEFRQKAHDMARARDYLRYVLEYANNAQELIKP